MPAFPLTLVLALLVLVMASGCGRTPGASSEPPFVSYQTPMAAELPPSADAHWGFAGAQIVRVGEGNAFSLAAPASPTWNAVPGVPVQLQDTDALISAKEGAFWFGRETPNSVESAALWIRSDAGPTTATPLPALPEGIRAQAGAVHRGNLYVVGTAVTDGAPHLFRLPLAKDSRWMRLSPLPAEIGNVLTVTTQNDGERIRLYFIGQARSGRFALTAYDPLDGKWMPPTVTPLQHEPRFTVPLGIAHLAAVTQPVDGTAPARVWIYNTITTAWTDHAWSGVSRVAAVRSAPARLVAVALQDNGRPEWIEWVHTTRARGLHWGDYLVLAAFFLTLIGISWRHSPRGRSSDTYFRGGRQIPWFAAGLSVVATRLSATSFISIPAKSFATNWQYTLIPVTNIVGAFIMSRWFVRFFVRLNLTSGYEYLEKRFSPLVRTLGSLNYLLYELSRIGILIVVPAVALHVVAKFDLSTTIVVIGAVVTVYTVIGGIEGVVWADVFQVGVKVAGLLVAIGFVFAQLEGSPTQLAATAWHENKLRLVNVSWDFTRDTLWVFILFWTTDGLKSYVANQTIIQRFISTRNEDTARRTIWSSALIGTAISWLFLLLGTGLYLFYRQQPGRLDLTMDKPDAVLPWYIVFELPPGVTGLLISALIAAAASSLAGALNSTSTVMVTDFYRRFSARPTDAGALRAGRVLTVLIGVFATGLALLLAQLSNKSLFDQTLSMIGLFGGGLGGLFLLGMLTTRTSSIGAVAGLVVSACVQYYVSRHTPLHLLTYMFTGMSSCFVTGYLVSRIWPHRKDVTGLTIHTTT